MDDWDPGAPVSSEDMAVNRSRSQNAELQEGMTDGTYKKMPPNRSVVENTLHEQRLMSWRFGFEDSRAKVRPDDPRALARWDPHDHG